MNETKPIWIDSEDHGIIKLESVKRGITMKKLVHDAVVEYLKNKKKEG